MKIKTAKPQTLIAALCLVLFSLVTSQLVLADDTDIYINQNSQSNTAPLVMFSVDWFSNLGNAACTFTNGDTDSQIVSECNTSNSNSGWTLDFVSNDLTTADKSNCNGGTGKCIISKFSVLRGALKQAMATLDGVKVGLMLNHANNCKPNTSGPAASGCSNGGYIASGFKLISLTSTTTPSNKDLFLQKLSAIPLPGSNSGHPFQGAELYFELYRYLTGQEVYNGHLGWEDYGNTNAADNLDGTPTLESPDYSAAAWDMKGTENVTQDASGNWVDVLDTAGYPTYVSPIDSTMSCAKIYVVNIMFQTSSADGDSNTEINKTVANGGMNMNLKTASDPFSATINWMYKNDMSSAAQGVQNVTSYFLVPKVTNMTNNYAIAGGSGNAIQINLKNPDDFTKKLSNIFSEVLSVSTTFVSASVPVNVFNRADYLNDVYLALFQAEKTPFWTGNLKKYMIEKDSAGLYYIGDNSNGYPPTPGNPVFDPSTGRINYNTLSFWTDPAAGDVQVTYDKNELIGLDGRSVNRGGAGEKIPGFLAGFDEYYNPYTSNAVGLINGTTRTVYTEPDPTTYTPGKATSLPDLNADSTTAGTLWNYLNADGSYASFSNNTSGYLNFVKWDTTDATYAAYQTTITANNTPDEAVQSLKWARGIDILDEGQDGNHDDSRNWIMGDPIHSTPLTINYGAHGSFSQTNPDVRIIITGNDGFVHMIQNTTSGGVESGKENWAFIPHASLGILHRLMKDAASGTFIHPYGVDGAPVAYVLDGNGDGTIDTLSHTPYPNDKVLLFFGMRRGGHHYYAMDITNPDQPKMLWDISNNSPGMSQLGLTFSTPRVAQMMYDAGSGTAQKHTVLVFGGGYYPNNKDLRGSLVTLNDKEGAGIYIVDAQTGKLVWEAVAPSATLTTSQTLASGGYALVNATFQDSIPAPVTVLDSDGDGYIDRLYVGDTGGRIWRADLNGTDPTKWSVHVLASIGQRDSTNTGNLTQNDDRRFFHAVDVVQTRNPNYDCSTITTNTACVSSNYVGMPYDAVIAGSGDRANPQDVGAGSYIPHNYLYVFKDYDVVSGTTGANPGLAPHIYGQAGMTDVTSDCLQTNNCSGSVDLTNGWKLFLNQGPEGKNQDEGEKALSKPLTVNGVIYFTTYIPPVPTTAKTKLSCSPSEGTGLTYAVTLESAGAAYDWDKTNTTTSSGTVINLGVTDRYKPSGNGIPANVIAIRKGGATRILTPGSNYFLQQKGQSAFKTFWYTKGE